MPKYNKMKAKNIYKIVVVATLPLLLQGCFVAKNYNRPEVKTEALYRTDQLPQDSISMASVSWKELFTDPILKNHIEKGLSNNLDIRVAMENVAIAQAYVKQGKAGYFPTFGNGLLYKNQKLGE